MQADCDNLPALPGRAACHILPHDEASFRVGPSTLAPQRRLGKPGFTRQAIILLPHCIVPLPPAVCGKRFLS